MKLKCAYDIYSTQNNLISDSKLLLPKNICIITLAVNMETWMGQSHKFSFLYK